MHAHDFQVIQALGADARADEVPLSHAVDIQTRLLEDEQVVHTDDVSFHAGDFGDSGDLSHSTRKASGLHNDVFVYDTQTDLFGTADPLPIDNNLPMSVVDGEQIYLLGGETGGGSIGDRYFGHHPDLFLVGSIAIAIMSL